MNLANHLDLWPPSRSQTTPPRHSERSQKRLTFCFTIPPKSSVPGNTADGIRADLAQALPHYLSTYGEYIGEPARIGITERIERPGDLDVVMHLRPGDRSLADTPGGVAPAHTALALWPAEDMRDDWLWTTGR